MRVAGQGASWRARFAAVGLLAVVGCSGGAEGPTTHPVTGMVTLEGKPVAEALVQFTPVEKDGVIAGAQAQTDAEGRFDVKIAIDKGHAEQRGLPVGEYRVSVTKMEIAGEASLDNPPRNVLPAKYATAESTPLTTTVKADGQNVVDVKL